MITYRIIETDLGYIALAGCGERLSHSCLPKSTKEEALSAIKEGLHVPCVEDNAGLDNVASKLVSYARGEYVDFSGVNIDIDSYPPFFREALLACHRIPYGQLVTYAELARQAGSQRAARAAGSAMANNRLPIIIPCHRVIASGGKIGGFSYDLEWKRSLLRLEGVDI